MSYLSDSIIHLFRGFSFYITTFSFLEGFFLSDWRGITLGIFVLLDTFINIFLKKITSSVFGDLGNRPEGAKDCGFIVSKYEPDTMKTSYGMPSGHSQSFAMVATLMALAINNNEPNYANILKIGLLILLTLTAMYLRVELGCHTIIQTAVGALIGIMVAFILVKYYKNPFQI